MDGFIVSHFIPVNERIGCCDRQKIGINDRIVGIVVGRM